MKTKTRQGSLTSEEIQSRTRRYGKIKKGLYTLAVAGFITAIGSQTYELIESYKHKTPKVVETHQEARTRLFTLQRAKKGLIDLVDSPYQTPEINEITRSFYGGNDRVILKLNKAIKSVEADISEIESKNKEYIQHTSRKVRNNGISLIGAFMMVAGLALSTIYEVKRKVMKRKLRI